MKRILSIAIFGMTLAQVAFANDPRYIVSLSQAATMGDPEAVATRLARTYGASVESVNGLVITMRMLPARAELLRRDPNVHAVTTAAVPDRIAATAIDWNSGVGYEYDGSGNVTKIGTDTFSYDVLSRLVEAHTGGVQRRYEYDAFGNRTKCVQNGAACQDDETIAASSNHSSIMTYDAAGNVQTHAGPTYSYDEFKMLTSDKYGALTREFVYDANDRRIGVLTSTTSGSWWRWTFRDPLSGKVLREFTSKDLDGRRDWKWEKDYVWRDSVLLATVQPNPSGSGTTTYHYHVDHLGTPRRITDDSDMIVGVHDYHAFGPEASGGTDERSLSLVKYTGHERDIVDGQAEPLDYMVARYYSAKLGRFLSVDPEMNVGKIMRQPQAWNRYSYVANNPINRTDPTGRCFWDVCVGEGIAAAAALTAATAYMLAPSRVPGKNNGQVMVDTAIGGFQALGRAVGNLIPGRQPTSLSPPPAPTTPSRPSTPGTQPTTGVNPSAPIQAHVVNTSQGPVTIPSDYTSRPADNGKGTVYQAPGATGNADTIRVMGPTAAYPNGYVRIYNEHGQPVTIDGKPLGRPETHLPIVPETKEPK